MFQFCFILINMLKRVIKRKMLPVFHFLIKITLHFLCFFTKSNHIVPWLMAIYIHITSFLTRAIVSILFHHPYH